MTQDNEPETQEEFVTVIHRYLHRVCREVGSGDAGAKIVIEGIAKAFEDLGEALNSSFHDYIGSQIRRVAIDLER